MPPDLGRSFPVDFAGIPPHMSAIDVVLWRRYRLRDSLPFVRLYFDVAVGRGAQVAPDLPAPVRAAWARITRQRVDVVGERVDGWTLIEIRGAAGPGAIGSLLVYRDLWRSDPPDDRRLELVLVTDVFAENLLLSLSGLDIRLVLV